MEKAFAKLQGGYANINDGGLPHNALRKLTGAPTSCIHVEEKNLKGEDQLFKQIHDADLKKHAIACGCIPRGKTETEK